MSWFCFMILSLMYNTGTISIYHFTSYFCLSVWLNSIYHFTSYFCLSVWVNIMTLFLFSPCHHHFRSQMFYLDDLTWWNECAYSSPKQVLPPHPQLLCFCYDFSSKLCFVCFCRTSWLHTFICCGMLLWYIYMTVNIALTNTCLCF